MWMRAGSGMERGFSRNIPIRVGGEGQLGLILGRLHSLQSTAFMPLLLLLGAQLSVGGEVPVASYWASPGMRLLSLFSPLSFF